MVSLLFLSSSEWIKGLLLWSFLARKSLPQAPSSAAAKLRTLPCQGLLGGALVAVQGASDGEMKPHTTPKPLAAKCINLTNP